MADPIPTNPVNSMGQNAPSVTPPSTPATPTADTSAAAAAPKQIMPTEQPQKPGNLFTNLSHSFMGAVLGGLSGGNNVVTGYDTSTTDPKTGGPTAITRPKTTHEKLSEIAGAALRGLAAGSQSQGTPGNTGGAAFGAGSQAQAQFQQKQDLLKRQQSSEQFKQDQDVLLHRGEIARNNGLTTQLYLQNLKASNDLDPQYAEYSTLMDAARKSPELSGHYREITGSELKDAATKDPNFLSNNIVRPLGLAPTMGEDGPLMHDDGVTPMQHMRYGVIDGVAAKDGKVVVTPDLESHIAQYGSKLTGNLPKVGDEVPLDRYIQLSSALDTEKLNLINGWNQSTVGTTTADGKLVQVNAYDHSQTRPLQTLTEANQDAINKGKLSQAQADEAEGKAAEARATAAMYMNGAGVGNDAKLWRSLPEVQHAIDAMPDSAKAIIKTVNPINIKPMILVANGDAKLNDEFPASPRPKTGQMSASQASAYLQFFNPNYTEHYYDDVKNLRKDFSGSGPQTSGGAVSSFNNFLNHSAEVLDASTALQRSGSPWIAKPLNELQSKGMGDPGVGNLNTAIMAARSEWQTFIHNGHVPTSEETAAGATLMNDASTPLMIAGALGVMGKQAVGRLDSINQRWKTVTGTDYPNLITPMGKASAQKLGLDVSAYKSGGQVPGANTQGQQATRPDGATIEYKDAQGNVVGHAVNGVYVPVPAAPAQGVQ